MDIYKPSCGDAGTHRVQSVGGAPGVFVGRQHFGAPDFEEGGGREGEGGFEGYGGLDLFDPAAGLEVAAQVSIWCDTVW